MMRTERATVKGHTYSILRGDGKALVSSKSDSDAWHAVRCGACDCEGFGFRGTCSHVKALAVLDLQERVAFVERDLQMLKDELAQLSGCAPSPAKALPALPALPDPDPRDLDEWEPDPELAAPTVKTAPVSKLHRLPQSVQDAIL